MKLGGLKPSPIAIAGMIGLLWTISQRAVRDFIWADLRECLPPEVIATLKEAVRKVDKTLPGFALRDAVMTGVETRSSSPIRIPRDPATLQCVGVNRFYPAGEGAGYAGGIISAAADGMRVAEALIKSGALG